MTREIKTEGTMEGSPVASDIGSQLERAIGGICMLSGSVWSAPIVWRVISIGPEALEPRVFAHIAASGFLFSIGFGLYEKRNRMLSSLGMFVSFFWLFSELTRMPGYVPLW